MKYNRLFLVSFLAAASSWLLPFTAGAGSPANRLKVDIRSLTQYVDPLIGTAHCRWFHFTPGARPFGMAKPAPSTNGHLGNKWGWEATGYDYRDQSIEGFPCLHEFQVGGIVLLPAVGKLVTVPGPLEMNAPYLPTSG